VIYRKAVAGVMAFPMAMAFGAQRVNDVFFPGGGPAGSQSGLREASFEATDPLRDEVNTHFETQQCEKSLDFHGGMPTNRGCFLRS